MHIGVVGNGFVGKATTAFANVEGTSLSVYDLDATKCVPEGCTLAQVVRADVIFVCVPTPMRTDGSCHTQWVEDVVADLRTTARTCQVPEPVLVIRSTVPCGTSERLGVNFMPEFLTEASAAADFKACPVWYFGTDTPDGLPEQRLRQLLNEAHAAGVVQSADLRVVSTRAAELIKYARNALLAVKVGVCNELAGLCTKLKVEYADLRDGFTSDPRIGAAHSMVPGPDGHYGFGGTCLVKALNSILTQAKQADAPCPILDAVRTRNATIDRVTHLQGDEGRAFLSI